MKPNPRKLLDQLSNLSLLSLNKTGFHYNPLGKLLARNLENLWFQQCVIKLAHNVFFTSAEKTPDALHYIKSNKVDSLPFGLAMLEQSKLKWNQWILDELENQNLSHQIAKVVVFTEESEVKDFFHVKQRERKVWWRKLACQPSRFNLTEVKKSKNCDVIEIQAQFPFGSITVESIKCYHDVQKLIPQNLEDEFQISETKAVEQNISLDWASLVLLFDGYQEKDSHVRLHLHPKITPYKVTFVDKVVDEDTDMVKKDLKDLILYLNNLLKTSGINTILTNNEQSGKTVQVPFVIFVDHMTLKNGIVYIKNQFTTLSESVHITQLIQHISSRCL